MVNNWCTYNTGKIATMAWAMDACDSTSDCSDWVNYTKGIKYAIDWDDFKPVEVIPKKLPAGKREMEMPDGAKLIVDDAGNYRIEDKDAQVTYKANRIREFSPYLNASDMLAKFVEYAGSIGVKRVEVLGLPIHLFISWLIIESAQRDGDQIPSDVIPVQQDPAIKAVLKPKCLMCGRFIKRLHCQHKFPFCGPNHAVIYAQRGQLIVPDTHGIAG